ncbi:OmpA family protein [Hydromonas duriensis]|uniref:Beta-barrel assembly machine subunit BamE n=1 Tax=Hydromonas duriensis TaxID=1527608 RepID=A0A4R6YBS9_9BURK|nr:OmpA family protein [Hydromonas duriensis]TDR33054.1 Beta-barrel assembly machine subunit BamE [Hydromonas duriensis]
MKTHQQLISATGLILSLFAVGAQAQNTAQDSAAVRFPELKYTYLKTGDFVNVDNLKNVGTGLHKDQVRRLLGNPHFSEGIGNPHVWNYAFNFYIGAAGGQYITCQYQVQYDDKYRVKATYWKDGQCENALSTKKTTPEPMIPVNIPVTLPVTLSADGLFAFGRSDLNSLQVSGRASLQQLASKINSSSAQLNSVSIVGYTDRFGSRAQNQALSAARAASVKAYLVQQGVPAHLIQTEGRGASNPVVNCPGAKTPQVIACLMPNRRIEVFVKGEFK